MHETTLVLQFQKQFNTFNQEQENQIYTIVEQYANSGAFIPIDTIAGSATTINIYRPFYCYTSYAFRIRIIAGSRISDYSNIVGDMIPPYAPSEFNIVSYNDIKRTFTWRDNSSDETGYRIERKLGQNGSYMIIGQLPPNTTKFTDSSLIVIDTTYIYKVNATYNNGVPSTSESVEMSTSLSPTNLRQYWAAITTSFIWEDNSNYEEGFIIERREGNGQYSVIATLPANTTSYIDQSSEQGKVYYYRIKAYTQYIQSKYSNEYEAHT